MRLFVHLIIRLTIDCIIIVGLFHNFQSKEEQLFQSFIQRGEGRGEEEEKWEEKGEGEGKSHNLKTKYFFCQDFIRIQELSLFMNKLNRLPFLLKTSLKTQVIITTLR